MIYTGLVSVTFRHTPPEEIVSLVRKAGLDGIEWGGDVHVPHGDTAAAAHVLKLTRDAGLKVAAYGSYYRAGEENDFCFSRVLDSAKALEAPVIRVWAGKLGSEDADENYRRKVIEDSFKIADAAEKENIQVAFEFHKKTLTDTNNSCMKLLNEINHKNMKCYWQPSQDMDITERAEGLKMLLPKLSQIHVFHWENGKRLALEAGMDEWKEYLKVIRNVPGDRYMMLEFVKDDSPLQYLEDAASLKRLISCS